VDKARHEAGHDDKQSISADDDDALRVRYECFLASLLALAMFLVPWAENAIKKLAVGFEIFKPTLVIGVR
jgi:hypothetical protein